MFENVERSELLRRSICTMIQSACETELTYLIYKGVFKDNYNKRHIAQVYGDLKVKLMCYVDRYEDILTCNDYGILRDVIRIDIDFLIDTTYGIYKFNIIGDNKNE